MINKIKKSEVIEEIKMPQKRRIKRQSKNVKMMKVCLNKNNAYVRKWGITLFIVYFK